MSDEYEYGPWVDVPDGGLVQLEGFPDGYKGHPTPRYRIATPKPKRELVVGKWYRSRSGSWHKLIGLEGEKPWFSMHGANHKAMRWGVTDVQCLDWSTPPRDEAPE